MSSRRNGILKHNITYCCLICTVTASATNSATYAIWKFNQEGMIKEEWCHQYHILLSHLHCNCLSNQSATMQSESLIKKEMSSSRRNGILKHNITYCCLICTVTASATNSATYAIWKFNQEGMMSSRNDVIKEEWYLETQYHILLSHLHCNCLSNQQRNICNLKV